MILLSFAPSWFCSFFSHKNETGTKKKNGIFAFLCETCFFWDLFFFLGETEDGAKHFGVAWIRMDNPLSMNACEGTEVAFNMGTARHGRRHFSTKKQIRLHIAIWVAVPTQLKLLNNTSVSIRFYCTPQLQALEAVACAHGVVGMAAQCILSISVTSVKHQGHYGTSLNTQGTAQSRIRDIAIFKAALDLQREPNVSLGKTPGTYHSDKGSTCCGLIWHGKRCGRIGLEWVMATEYQHKCFWCTMVFHAQ